MADIKKRILAYKAFRIAKYVNECEIIYDKIDELIKQESNKGKFVVNYSDFREDHDQEVIKNVYDQLTNNGYNVTMFNNQGITTYYTLCDVSSLRIEWRI